MAIQINQKKLDRQLMGADRWKNAGDLGLSHANGWGTWNWWTGVGKTYAACYVANKMITKNNSRNIIVVVPGPDLETQWNDSIKSFSPSEHIPNFEVLTVHKIMDYINSGKRLVCTLIIFDELHEYLTDDRFRMFDGNNIVSNWGLGLTATYEDIHGRHKSIEHILPIVDKIDEQEALREGYISKYVEFNVAVPLLEHEQQKYKHYSEIITKNMSKFGRNGLDLATEVLADKTTAMKIASVNGWRAGMDLSVPGNYQIFSLWSPDKVFGYAKNLMDAIRERKTLVYTATNKLIIARDVVVKYSTLKAICFSQSTAFADALCKIINKHYVERQQDEVCVSYHSQLPTIIYKDEKGKEKKKGKVKLKREAIEAIRSGKKRVISTASSLDKGFDVEDIKLGVCTSGTQNPTQYTQRKGRVVRVVSGAEDDIMLVINLYIKGTMDETSLRNRQSKTKSLVYWVDTIDDITYTPQRNDTFNLKTI